MIRIKLLKDGHSLIDMSIETLMLMQFHAQGIAPELPVDIRVEIEDAQYCGNNGRDVHFGVVTITPDDDDEYIENERKHISQG